MKKKDGKADANGTKKNLQFVGVNGGWAGKYIIKFSIHLWLGYIFSVYELWIFQCDFLTNAGNE